MPLTLNIEADTIDDLRAKAMSALGLDSEISRVANVVKELAADDPIEATPAPEPAKRTRRTKAEAPAAEEPTTAEAKPNGKATDTEMVSYDHVKRLVLALVAVGKRAAVTEVLEGFDVDHANKLTEDQWPDAIEQLQAHLPAGDA